MARHKWNGNSERLPKATSNNGGMAVACLKCGCVREYVHGLATYFIDNIVYIQAPKCDERILKQKEAK